MSIKHPLIFFLLTLLYFSSCDSSAVEKIPGDDATVFLQVNVIPMTGDGILENQTVVVRNGKIEKIAPFDSLEIGEGATLIQGEGKFLMPGLSEMHAHIPVAREGNDSLVRETLLLYLSGGITVIRGMLGNPYHLELRTAVEKGQILGPRVFTSSPSMNGNTVQTIQEANDKTTQYQQDGYDFLKIHPGIELGVFQKLVETANQVGISFSGHVPVAVGIDRAIDFQYASIDHLDGYIYGLVPKDDDFDPAAGGLFGIEFTDFADESKIPDLVKRTKDAGVWIVPTQILLERWTDTTTGTELVNEEGTQYLPPRLRYQWRLTKDQILEDNQAHPERNERFIALRRALLKEMEKQGVSLLLGSDAPQVGNVPGFSIHYEIDALLRAGLSPHTIIESGTANPARFFDQEGKFGTLEQDSEADLLLVSANPLEDPTVLRDHEGVMVRGRWLSRQWLDEQLMAIAEKYKE